MKETSDRVKVQDDILRQPQVTGTGQEDDNVIKFHTGLYVPTVLYRT